MSIRIKKETCIGCGQCIDVCPGSLIGRGKDGKAQMQYPKDCWGCVSCVKECPVGAIDFYLGADMGGRGSTMHTVKKDASPIGAFSCRQEKRKRLLSTQKKQIHIDYWEVYYE